MSAARDQRRGESAWPRHTDPQGAAARAHGITLYLLGIDALRSFSGALLKAITEVERHSQSAAVEDFVDGAWEAAEDLDGLLGADGDDGTLPLWPDALSTSTLDDWHAALGTCIRTLRGWAAGSSPQPTRRRSCCSRSRLTPTSGASSASFTTSRRMRQWAARPREVGDEQPQ